MFGFGKRLKGVRVALLTMDGFEQVEVTVPRRALQALGAEVDIVAPKSGRLRGVNSIYPGGKITVDARVEDAGPEHYGALLIPGGLVAPDSLRQNPEVLNFVRRMAAAGRPIATLCHGPWVLISAGLAYGRRLAAWPGIRDDLWNAGAVWVNEPGCLDGRIFSSRGPQDLKTFVSGTSQLFERYAARDLPAPERLSGWRKVGAFALPAAGVGLGMLGLQAWRKQQESEAAPRRSETFERGAQFGPQEGSVTYAYGTVGDAVTSTSGPSSSSAGFETGSEVTPIHRSGSVSESPLEGSTSRAEPPLY